MLLLWREFYVKEFLFLIECAKMESSGDMFVINERDIERVIFGGVGGRGGEIIL